MTMGRLKQWLFEALRVGRAHAEFRKLETEKLQEMKDAREDRDGRDIDGISGDYGGYEAISRRIVFDERSIGGNSGLFFFEGKNRRGFGGGGLAFVGREFPPGGGGVGF